MSASGSKNFGLIIIPAQPPSTYGSVAPDDGARFSCTVTGSTTSIDSMGFNWLTYWLFSSVWARSMLAFTAVASIGEPSWNVASSRSVSTRAPSTNSQSVTRYGSSTLFGPTQNRRSYIRLKYGVLMVAPRICGSAPVMGPYVPILIVASRSTPSVTHSPPAVPPVPTGVEPADPVGVGATAAPLEAVVPPASSSSPLPQAATTPATTKTAAMRWNLLFMSSPFVHARSNVAAARRDGRAAGVRTPPSAQ